MDETVSTEPIKLTIDEVTEHALNHIEIVPSTFRIEYPFFTKTKQNFTIEERRYFENGVVTKRGWCVTDGTHCLQKDNTWMYEMRPSERTDEFIENTRFETIELAIAAFRQWFIGALKEREDLLNDDTDS